MTKLKPLNCNIFLESLISGCPLAAVLGFVVLSLCIAMVIPVLLHPTMYTALQIVHAKHALFLTTFLEAIFIAVPLTLHLRGYELPSLQTDAPPPERYRHACPKCGTRCDRYTGPSVWCE